MISNAQTFSVQSIYSMMIFYANFVAFISNALNAFGLTMILSV